MERDGNPWKALAFSTPATNPAGYYPADNEIVLNLTDIDNDTFAGAEVRFGSTLGQCGNYGWEVAYWGLLEETTTAVVTDLSTDANRLYTMIPHTGMFYNGRSVNDYYEYGPPTANPAGDTIRLRQVTARNSFSMQNLELNFLRFPIRGGGSYSAPVSGAYGGSRGRGLGRRGGNSAYGAGGCGAGGCGVSSCGGCDTCAGSSCGTSCCGGGSRFSATGVVGVRYVRIDEDFLFRADFDNETAVTTGFISHDVDVDSHLVGAQFGCNMLYRMGCSGRWALHCNSVFGIYGNHMEVWNRMDAPVGGGAVTNNDGSTFDYRYEDDDIAFLGELRAGASYQYSCNWRLFGGYRMLGMGGMALAFDQISDQNISAAQTSYVDSDGSIFIHGLQGGVEFTY
ncbi:MAG: BBP7 family outer membrane beta-barrel protein [Acidimicrobiales bacterium]